MILNRQCVLNYLGDKDYQHGSTARSGVLVVNLGTPKAPTTIAVRRFLSEFLSDPRVVELPRPLWWLILHLLVLPLRPRKSAQAYAKIWLPEGSPLLVYSELLSSKVLQRLRHEHPDLILKLAMRYDEPSIEDILNEMREKSVRRLLILPLFPHYSATTTASVFDKVTRILSTWRWQPEVRYINHYHKHPLYISACAEQIHKFREQHGSSNILVFSFHGLPKRNLLQGDPYHCQCHATARLIAQALSLKEHEYKLCFQSQFGRAEWLQPYTEQTLCELAKQGVRTVDIFCPGFSVDCLETLEEIAIRGSDVFKRAGGAQLNYIPALNDNPAHVECIADLISKNITGWGIEDIEDTQISIQAKAKALAMGAAQ